MDICSLYVFLYVVESTEFPRALSKFMIIIIITIIIIKIIIIIIIIIIITRLVRNMTS